MRGIQGMAALVLMAALGCDRRPGGDFERPPLASPFDGSAESAPAYRHCLESEGMGCASIYAAGTLVRSGFAFENIYARCHRAGDSLQVDIVNSLVLEPSFSARLTFPLPSLAPLQLCGDGEGGCFARFRIHATYLTSSAPEPCQVVFLNEEFTDGALSCPLLQGPGGTLTIGAGSRFSCGH